MSPRAVARGPRPGTAVALPFEAIRARAIGLLDAPRPLLVVTDFDGTLSAIDPDPRGARIDPLGN